MTNQTIEQAVEEICGILNSIPEFKTVVDEDTHVGIQDTLREALQAQRDAGAREEKKRIYQEYIVLRKETKEERNQSNAWNDLGNTLRNEV